MDPASGFQPCTERDHQGKIRLIFKEENSSLLKIQILKYFFETSLNAKGIKFILSFFPHLLTTSLYKFLK